MPHSQRETLPGLEKPIDLNSRNAFGRVPKPEYFGIDPFEFSDVTEEERAAADVDRCFKRRLYGGKEGETVDGLALNSMEYEAIIRSPGAFAVAVAAKTNEARTLDTNRERRDETVQRSVEHAVESKQQRTEKVISGLESERTSLQRLLKEMRSPGYAHMNEAEMRILAETARTSFDNLLNVTARRAGWTPEQRQRAEKAMNARLFDTNYKQAFSYWRELTELADQYAGQKLSLFARKARAAQRVANS